MRGLLKLLPAGIVAGLLALSISAVCADQDDGWLHPTPEKLPRWRGFNLQNKFFASSNPKNDRPYDEADFRIIHELGFNFARLPLDYRIWITDGDWTKINEAAFGDIDKAIEYGEKYKIHVCLNFHRAPGYTVAKPPEARDLWTDPEAQRVCAMHWAFFARRYKGIPNERLSFNLFNEPGRIDPKVYAAVVTQIVAAIRKEDPDRLIIVDGLRWGNEPCPELASLHVAQATRGYAPMWLTHYDAPWISNSNTWPVPEWPGIRINAFLYGTSKKEYHGPLTLTGQFPAGTRLNLVVGTVSNHAHLVIRADNKLVFEKNFVSGPVSTDGEKVSWNAASQIYSNDFEKPLTVSIPDAASKLTIGVEDGDWMTLKSFVLQTSGTASYPLTLVSDWGYTQTTAEASFDPANTAQPWGGSGLIDRNWLWKNQILPWKALEAQGVGVIVGEWGCYSHTPYEVTLRWMADCLANFKQAGWGWALWDLSGSFGILDSNRPGAVCEDFEGHKLDRRMLKLLQDN